jgi:hypothetical protein
MMTQGICLCGALKYEVTAAFDDMLHCHCSMCRKHHGTAFATFASAPLTAFHWLAGENATSTYASSDAGKRFFCKRCGSVAPTLVPDAGFALCPAGNLLGDPGIRPRMHMFVGSKAPWYSITDKLPQHEAYPPEFGGGGGIERLAGEFRPGVIGGRCLCGDVAYESGAPPLRMYNCHCSRCRRGRSAAHATNLIVKLDEFRFTRGESLVAEYKPPEARYFTATFCTRCGAKVPRIARERGIAVVPAGGLDTDPGMRPQAHIFVGSKASWFEITDNAPQFVEGLPA